MSCRLITLTFLDAGACVWLLVLSPGSTSTTSRISATATTGSAVRQMARSPRYRIPYHPGIDCGHNGSLQSGLSVAESSASRLTDSPLEALAVVLAGSRLPTPDDF
eukprot:scaffold99391_cov38-Prasinocladus_malaysianus.AAC.1